MVNLTALADVLDRARASAEDLMTDTCTVRHVTGTGLDDNGLPVTVADVVYEGACKVQTYGGVADQTSGSATGDSTNIGGTVPIWNLMVHFPFAEGRKLHSGDIVEITGSCDPSLLRRRMRLVNLQSEKAHATASRWNVNEIVDGGLR